MKRLKAYLTSEDFVETFAFVGAYISCAGMLTTFWWAHYTHAASVFGIFG